jgi:hypothetical protein
MLLSVQTDSAFMIIIIKMAKRMKRIPLNNEKVTSCCLCFVLSLIKNETLMWKERKERERCNEYVISERD